MSADAGEVEWLSKEEVAELMARGRALLEGLLVQPRLFNG